MPLTDRIAEPRGTRTPDGRGGPSSAPTTTASSTVITGVQTTRGGAAVGVDGKPEGASTRALVG